MKRMAWLKRTRIPHADTSDAAEFEQLLREHVPALYRSAYRWTGAVDRAEDLVQQLLLRLYPRLAELRELDQLRPWALRVMYRIFVDQLRRERSSPVQFGADRSPMARCRPARKRPGSIRARGRRSWSSSSSRRNACCAPGSSWARSTAWCCRCTTSRTTRLPELAQIMDIPLGTLKSRLHRARARLRELLATERMVAADRV